MLKHDIAKQGSAKSNFDHIYDQPDPGWYFRELWPLDYRAPQSALPIFQACIQSLQQLRNREQVSILDLCSSYGINASLINHRVTLSELYAHYTDDQRDALPLIQRLTTDQDFFARRRVASPHQIFGIDVARNALAYARLTGLMPQSFATNLEDQSPPTGGALADALSDIDLIIVTGGLSYIGAATFRRILRAIPQQRRPWVACFPLRISSFEGPIAEFSRFGLKTEQPQGRTFKQRKFRDDAERNRVIEQLRKMNLDPTGKEADGYLHGSLYLSRPGADIMRVPFKQLVDNQ